MRPRHWLPPVSVGLAVLIGHLILLQGQGTGDRHAYFAAAYTGERNLVLFPLDGPKIETLLLPVPLGGHANSSDAVAIFATAAVDIHEKLHRNSLFRIDVPSMKLFSIADLSRFRLIRGIAISPQNNRAAILGKYWGGTAVVCGIFSLDLSNGNVNHLLDSNDCDDSAGWSDMSLAPDGSHIVAVHRRSLEIIDLSSGAVKQIGQGFFKTAWSPDGKWIAASSYSLGNAETTLFDTASLMRVRTFGTPVVLRVFWSPDSRLLLFRSLEAGCGPDEFTFRAVDIRNGQSRMLESSQCRVTGDDLGWIAE